MPAEPLGLPSGAGSPGGCHDGTTSWLRSSRQGTSSPSSAAWFGTVTCYETGWLTRTVITSVS